MHQKGDHAQAQAAYEELWQKKYLDPTYLLPYTILLLRNGGEAEAQKAKEILRAVEKVPNLPQQKEQEIHVNYACAQYKLGNLQEAIHLLEASHKHAPCGNIYETLGYLYVEAGDVEKGIPFNEEALEYDDEDAIVLDNIAQMYYRVLNDKEKALPYFKKALEFKEGQIDTLYFLAQYDIEAGDKQAAVEKLEKALAGRFSPLNYAKKEMIEELLKTLRA